MGCFDFGGFFIALLVFKGLCFEGFLCGLVLGDFAL